MILYVRSILIILIIFHHFISIFKNLLSKILFIKSLNLGSRQELLILLNRHLRFLLFWALFLTTTRLLIEFLFRFIWFWGTFIGACRVISTSSFHDVWWLILIVMLELRISLIWSYWLLTIIWIKSYKTISDSSWRS